MLRMIIGDYIVNFKAAYKRMWKRQNHNWFTAVYPFLYMFWFCFLNLDESKNIVIAPMNIIQIAFIIFGAWLAELYPNRLEKSMFLCPMTQKDRKEYLVTAYGLRVVLFWVPYILAEVVNICVYRQKLIYGIIKIASYVFLMASINLFLEVDTAKLEKKSSNSRLFGYEFVRTISVIVGIIVLICFHFAIFETEKGEMLFYLIGFAIQAVVSFVYLVKYFDRVMQVAQDYEKAYCMETN